MRLGCNKIHLILENGLNTTQTGTFLQQMYPLTLIKQIERKAWKTNTVPSCKRVYFCSLVDHFNNGDNVLEPQVAILMLLQLSAHMASLLCTAGCRLVPYYISFNLWPCAPAGYVHLENINGSIYCDIHPTASVTYLQCTVGAQRQAVAGGRDPLLWETQRE